MATSESHRLLDVEEYASRYSGRVKVLRLIHLVNKKLLDGDQVDAALKLAFDAEDNKGARKDPNILKALAEAKKEAKKDSQVLPGLDSESIKAIELSNQEAIESLERIVRHRKNKVEKDASLANQEELTHHVYLLGLAQYNSGYSDKAFSTLKQIPTSILLFESALDCGRFKDAYSIAEEAKVTYFPRFTDNDPLQARFKMRCVEALSHLCSSNYYEAALSFIILMKFAPERSFEALTWEDVHMCMTWTVFASMTHEELMETSRHLDPQRVSYDNLLLFQLYEKREYSSCVLFLEKHLKPRALLDMYLFPHVDKLISLIKEKISKEEEG